MGGVPIAVIPHPLAGNTPQIVQDKAAAVVDEILAILTQPAEQLADAYRDRFLKPMEKKIERVSA